MVLIIPIIVVCCVAFFAISTGVACFIHHRNMRKPVRGIVLREDGVVAVPGRVVEPRQATRQNLDATMAVPSAIGSAGNREGTAPPSAVFAAGGEPSAAETHYDSYVVQEVFNLSEEERHRREMHNRRLNAEGIRMAYPMRGDGTRHSLDGTPLAQLVTFFRNLRRPRSEEEASDADGANAADAPPQHGGQAEEEAANVNYGRYLVAVDITLREPDNRQSRRSTERKASGADSTITTEPYGGRTERDWAALNDTSGIDYMTNEGVEYLPRT